MKKILAILLTGVIIAGIGFAVGIGINYILSKIKFQSPDEIATKFEKSAEEVLGEDFNSVVSKAFLSFVIVTHKVKHLQGGLLLIRLKANPSIEHLFYIRSQFHHIIVCEEL